MRENFKNMTAELLADETVLTGNRLLRMYKTCSNKGLLACDIM
jgi:hypothetical protein